jgi:pimeloyl-ACP methyl ester carboxylesterase
VVSNFLRLTRSYEEPDKYFISFSGRRRRKIGLGKVKKSEGVKKLRKKTSLVIMLIATFTISLFAKPQFVTKVTAQDYTETEGTLDGADFVLRIPDQWNGMLVVLCRGYSHTPVADVRTVAPFSEMAPILLSKGCAVAASNYGVGGFCVSEGVNSTYQLTEYIIDNYDVTGKVFLIGGSMGGAVALLLGEKYPELYSGVIDIFGSKEMKSQYETKVRWASLNDSELTAELTALTAPAPPYMFPTLATLRAFCTLSATDIKSSLGGTPQEKPEAYESVSPVYHANISIPVITVHGTSDALVPYSQSLIYQEAVANAGRSYLYRLYNVTGGQHGSSDVMAEVSARFDELAAWSDVIPEGLTIGVMLLLSTVAAIVGIRYLRKRPKWKRR